MRDSVGGCPFQDVDRRSIQPPRTLLLGQHMSEGPEIGAEILLVDDNRDDVTLTLWAFRKSGFSNEIVVARDGAEALDLLLPTNGRRALRPAIVLLDINMPKIGGLEVLRLLRDEPSTKSLPDIMLTSSVGDEDVGQSYDCGANSYLQNRSTWTSFSI